MRRNKPNIVIISTPVPLRRRTVEVFILNQLDLLEPVCGKIYLLCANFPSSKLSGRRVESQPMQYNTEGKPPLVKALKFMAMQFNLAYRLWRLPREEYEAVFFYFGASLIFPVIAARVRGKRVAILATGSPSHPLKQIYGVTGRLLFYPISRLLELTCYRLAHQINVQSRSAVSFLGLQRFRHKVVVNGAVCIDTRLFSPQKPLEARSLTVGYVGRLAWEKGVMNLVQSIPRVLSRMPGATFHIIGEGNLRPELEKQVARLGVEDKVKFTDWVSHEELPEVLNDLKLLVLPSYTEGLPSSAQEAMSCGTPVLATSVGGIPDLIQDGATGFLMPDNSPETVGQNIIRALGSPALTQIACQGRELIIENYTLPALIEKSKQALQELLKRV